MWRGGGGGEIMGWARPIFFREKGWAKREFHDDWVGSLYVPDQSVLPEFKYLSVHTSSNNDEIGKKRISDDW